MRSPASRGGRPPGEGRRRVGLTSRRGGRASVCRNLDTLKRFMAAGTAAVADAKTQASALRCKATSRASRHLRPHPQLAARRPRPRPDTPWPIAGCSCPPGHAPSASPAAPAPPALPSGQSPLGRPPRPRPDAGGGWRGWGSHVLRAVCPPPRGECVGPGGYNRDFVYTDLPPEAF